MRAVVIPEPGRIEIAEVPDPTPAPGEAIVEVAASGICGTDLHILQGEEGVLPVTPGHEFAGTVVAVGRGVSALRVGDRVAADPNIPCRSCRFCRDGRVNLCENYSAVGVTRAGSAADYVAVPAELCVVVPAAVPLAHAAFAEPLACAIHALDLLHLRSGASVLIVGAGTMGLTMLQLVGSGGAAHVDLVDTNARKLEPAAGLGARHRVTSFEELDDETGWDVVIDATGNLAAIRQGLERVGRGGTFLQFGVASPGGGVMIDPHRIYEDELRIIGAVCPADAYGRAIRQLDAGRVTVEPLISHRVPLQDYPEAVAAFARGETRKCLVMPHGE